MGPLSIEQVLAAEAASIHNQNDPDTKAIIEKLHRLAGNQDRATERADKDADQRSGDDENRDWVADRKTFYCELNKLKRAALCCSGGGIRSATFCLGIIQALAKHNMQNPAPDPSDTTLPPEVIESNANQSFLSRFHYLSTVSGGGYVGSWSSACSRRFPACSSSPRST